MIWSNADGVGPMGADPHSPGDRTEVDHPGDAMRGGASGGHIELPVATGRFPAGPFPTLARFCDLFPEPVADWSPSAAAVVAQARTEAAAGYRSGEELCAAVV